MTTGTKKHRENRKSNNRNTACIRIDGEPTDMWNWSFCGLRRAVSVSSAAQPFPPCVYVRHHVRKESERFVVGNATGYIIPRTRYAFSARTPDNRPCSGGVCNELFRAPRTYARRDWGGGRERVLQKRKHWGKSAHGLENIRSTRSSTRCNRKLYVRSVGKKEQTESTGVVDAAIDRGVWPVSDSSCSQKIFIEY